MQLKEFLTSLVEKRVSSAHLIPGSPIMVRQKNIFQHLGATVLKPQDIEDFISQLITDEQKKKLEANMEIDFAYSVPGLSRFRINVYTQRSTRAAVITLNPFTIPTFEDLSLPEILKNTATEARQGLVVIVGSKGSGKSSTLAAIIEYILENRACQILTFEDPVEFLFKNKKGVISQREIGTDTPSYKHAFQSINHQGVDILVVSEVNNFEVAYNISKLAAGGTLVLATVTSPAIQVFLEQFVDLFPPNLHHQAQMLLSISLQLIVSQTLCLSTSGEGFVPAFEILTGSPVVKTYLREGKFSQVQTIMSTTGRESGMQTQEQALRSLVKKDLITLEEANSKAIRVEEFKKIMSLPY